jgi:hypothetical protein
MAMPPQLRKTPRRNPRARGYAPKPVTDTLPCLNVNELLHAIPRNYDVIRTQSFTSTSHPQIISLRLTYEAIEVIHPSLHRGQNGNVQTLRLKWIRTGFGRPRPAIYCDKCGRPFIKLYNKHNDLSCRHCHGAIYLSQSINQHQRPILKAHRLERFLLLKTNAQQRTRNRLLRRFGEKALEPQTNYNTHTPRHWK